MIVQPHGEPAMENSPKSGRISNGYPAPQIGLQAANVERADLEAALFAANERVIAVENYYRSKLQEQIVLAESQTQAAQLARSKLELIENSLSWRAVRYFQGKLDRYPKLREFLGQSARLLWWTISGELPRKLKHYKNLQRFAKAAGISDRIAGSEEAGAILLQATVLPLDVFRTITTFVETHGEVGLILSLNFYAGGGAESAALNYIRSYVQDSKKSAILILTDNGPRKTVPDIPENVLVIDLMDFPLGGHLSYRESYLFLILRSISFEIFHIVNSIAGFNLIRRMHDGFFDKQKIIASVFALQFNPNDRARLIGYAHEFLPTTIDKIDCVVTDNHRFALEAPLKLDLVSSAEKFHVVYNMSKLDDCIDFDSSRSYLQRRIEDLKSSSRMRVIWAGRLDKEKRIDLLLDVARLTESFCDFAVFGGAVVDGGFETALAAQRNIRLCGPYASPLEWDRETTGHVFLFTSIWEGMPNTIIEAAYLGYPIVASKVGGVGELITEETGWGIDSDGVAEDYVRALMAIFEDRAITVSRTRALIALVHERHSREAYLSALRAVPGYSNKEDH